MFTFLYFVINITKKKRNGEEKKKGKINDKTKTFDRKKKNDLGTK